MLTFSRKWGHNVLTGTSNVHQLSFLTFGELAPDDVFVIVKGYEKLSAIYKKEKSGVSKFFGGEWEKIHDSTPKSNAPVQKVNFR